MANKLTRKEFDGQIEALIIGNDSELQHAYFLTKECKRLKAETLKEFKAETSKYHALHKEAKEKEKEASLPFDRAEKILKEAIATYQKEQEAKRIELEKQQEEEKALFGVALTETKEAVKLGGTHVRKTWKARVVDEDKVPTHFMKKCIRPVDMSALNDIAKFSDGTAVIDGVEFYQEETLVIK